MKICRINMSLTKDGFKHMILEYDAVKKTKIYKCTRTDGEDVIIRNVPIDALLMIESIYHNSPYGIRYHLYCLKEDIDTALLKLKKVITETALSYKESIDALTTHI